MSIDHPGDLYLADVSIPARAAVDDVVEYRIEREYGIEDAEDAMGGAAIRAVILITDDIRPRYTAATGSDHGIKGLAEALLRMLVTAGLEARLCQCNAGSDPHARVGHDHVGECSGHYEADVPPIDGMLMCGTCHGAVWRARGGQ